MVITPVPTAQNAIAGITNLKGKVITVFNLCELLGLKKNENTTSTVIFKSDKDEDLMGLLIEKTGALVNIDDKNIRPPNLATGTEESFCISGIAESKGKLYRIIDIHSIIGKFKKGELK
jgi:chemotaxis signal transduction protein